MVILVTDKGAVGFSYDCEVQRTVLVLLVNVDMSDSFTSWW